MTITEGLGVALALLGLAFAFETPRHWFLRIARLRRKPHSLGEVDLSSDPASPPAPTKDLQVQAPNLPASPPTSLSVKEIVDVVGASPLLQRNAVSNNYAGIRVSWTGYLRSADADFQDASRVRVNLIVNKDEIVDYSFWFSVELALVPELKVLRRNSKLRVTGRIVSVAAAGLSVDIEPTEVEVLERIIA